MKVPSRSSSINNKLSLTLLLWLGLASLVGLSGCGGSSSKDEVIPPIEPVGTQMGGSRQGTEMNLTATVTSFAGTYYETFSATDVVGVGDFLYVTGTDNNNPSILKISISTNDVTIFAGSESRGSSDGTGVLASFNEPTGIASDGSNLYVADSQNNNIRQISIASGEVTTLAGSGTEGSADGVGLMASFYHPYGLVTDGSNLFVADTYNHLIRQINLSTGEVSTLAGSGVRGSDDAIGVMASFSDPRGVTYDGTYLYVADTGSRKIRQINPSTGAVTTLAGSIYGSSDGIGAAASFAYPVGITTDGLNLYVTDRDKHSIRQIDISSAEVKTISGSGECGLIDGALAKASYCNPEGIEFVGDNLYLMDQHFEGDINSIRKVNVTSGTVSTVAGAMSREGLGLAARFRTPSGITTDGINLYLVEEENHLIRKIDIATQFVTTLAGSVFGSTDGVASLASFSFPSGISTDGVNLYVVDSGSYKIRQVALASGEVTTLAGSGSEGSTDGVGTMAEFRGPLGITTDGNNLYVSDYLDNKIRQINLTTREVTTLAGSGALGTEDGAASLATFYGPVGITTDGSNLYVCDRYNIRQINIASGEVTTLAGSGVTGSDDGIGTLASFSWPNSITTDGSYLYVSESSKIRRVDITSGEVITLAGSGTEGGVNGVGTMAEFRRPYGITTDGVSLYVADYADNTVRRIQ